MVQNQKVFARKEEEIPHQNLELIGPQDSFGELNKKKAADMLLEDEKAAKKENNSLLEVNKAFEVKYEARGEERDANQDSSSSSVFGPENDIMVSDRED